MKTSILLFCWRLKNHLGEVMFLFQLIQGRAHKTKPRISTGSSAGYSGYPCRISKGYYSVKLKREDPELVQQGLKRGGLENGSLDLSDHRRTQDRDTQKTAQEGKQKLAQGWQVCGVSLNPIPNHTAVWGCHQPSASVGSDSWRVSEQKWEKQRKDKTTRRSRMTSFHWTLT